MIGICLEVVCPSEGRFVLSWGGLGSQGWGGGWLKIRGTGIYMGSIGQFPRIVWLFGRIEPFYWTFQPDLVVVRAYRAPLLDISSGFGGRSGV